MRILRPKQDPLFSLKEEKGRGRTVMLSSAVIVSIINWLTSGLFYTSFLMIYGINLVNISIIAFIPYIAGCFGIFSPSLLERFKKRRWLLASVRFIYYTLNILGITLVPVFVSGKSAQIAAFIAIIFIAGLINSLTSSGYTVWHVNFIPAEIRADYFSRQTLISSFIGISASLISAFIADSLVNSPYQDTIILSFRYVAYALALLEIFILLTPKEYPYAQSLSKPRLKDIFTLPFSNKPFIMSMAVIFLYTFTINIPASSLNYYLINNVGAEYTFIYAINMLYPFTLLFLLPFAKKIISKYGWFRTFAFFVLLTAPTNFMYSCVTPANYLWLFPLVRIIQHIFGTAYNIAYANMALVNLPKTDQTNYMSFHLLTVNIAACLGMVFATAFIAWNGSNVISFMNINFTSVQMLLWIEFIGEILVAVFVMINLKTLSAGDRPR